MRYERKFVHMVTFTHTTIDGATEREQRTETFFIRRRPLTATGMQRMVRKLGYTRPRIVVVEIFRSRWA